MRSTSPAAGTLTAHRHPVAGLTWSFARDGRWYAQRMWTDATPQHDDERPLLLFFSARRSGPARRMSSLVAWVGVTEKRRLRVVEVDTDANPALARALGVSSVPALVLLRDKREVGRLEGRATGAQIDRFLRSHA